MTDAPERYGRGLKAADSEETREAVVMTDLIYEMGRLVTHAAATHQTPTCFVLGDDAFSMFRIICRDPNYRVVSNYPVEPTLFGVLVRRDVRLPRCRVVLEAGQNTVGAFSVSR